ncbi:MAG: SRPBCC family protein [Gaiellaceae bacterium]
MTETATIAPVAKSVHVACDPERAFRVFTREIGSWWPLDTHAIHAGEVREVVWEEHVGGEVYEISNGGERAHWATVLDWDPPSRAVIAWHVNPDAPAPTEIEVRFSAEGDGTRVDLEHHRWERLGSEAHATRGAYATGWDSVLGRYTAHLA